MLAFFYSTPIPTTLQFTQPHHAVQPLRKLTYTLRPSPRSPRLIPHTLTRACAVQTAQVGQVVAVEQGRGRVSLARITGVASSGDTVDLVLLEEFVKEMYVQSKEPSTYEAAKNVRVVRSEYVPSQQGWIVLNQDLQQAKNYFKSRPVPEARESVTVKEAPKEVLSEEALKRQVFTPTKTQAFLGAALSVPLAVVLFKTFSAARDSYAASPAGEELLSGELFRKLILFVTSAGSVASLVVGAALLVSALSKTEEEE